MQRFRIAFLDLKNVHYILLSLFLLIGLIAVWYSAVFSYGNVLVAISFNIYIITIFTSIFIIGRKSTFIHPIIFFIIWFELFKGVVPRFNTYLIGSIDHRAISLLGLDGSAVIVKHLLLSSFFIISLTLGYFLSARLKLYSYMFSEEKNSTKKLLLVFLISIISFIFIVKGAGGIGNLLLQRGIPNSERYLSQFDSGPLVILIKILRFLCIAWLAVNFKSWLSPTFIFVFICSLVMTFVVTGSRGGIILPIIIATIVIFSSNNLKKIPYVKVLLMSSFLLLVLSVTSQFREMSQGKSEVNEIELDIKNSERVLSALETINVYAIDGDGSFAILSKVPKYEGYLFGQSYLSIPFAPIPSSLLPFEKPVAGGKLTAQVFYHTDENTIPPKYVGEAYWNFSYLGIFFIALIYGVIMGAFYRTLIKNNYHPFLLTLYLLTIFTLQPTSDGFYAWLHTAFPVFLFLIFISGIPRKVNS